MREDRIITEVGTNEWQVVVFTLGDQSFAINVDKTREILQWARSPPGSSVASGNAGYYHCSRRGHTFN